MKTDGADAKVIRKNGIEIYAPAKQGGRPDTEANSDLKVVIELAKQSKVTKQVIERALEKVKGSCDETCIEGR